MKLKYLIPFIGLILIWNDIPHTESQRPYKSLQGPDVILATSLAWLSTLSTIGMICTF